MQYLRQNSSLVVFSEATPDTAAPRLRVLDWMRTIPTQAVANPSSQTILLAPGESRLIFDGTRTLTVDGTTALSLALVPGDNVHYRLRHIAGTSPGFRTARTFSANGGTVAIAVAANETAIFSISGGTFTGISAGDTLWLPGTEESVTSPFSVVNRGFWLVMSVSASQMTCRRTSDFNGENQTGIAISAVNQIRAFSADGVQVGDTAELISGFASANLGSFSIVAATSAYIDIQSIPALAAETSVLPTAAGLAVRSARKRLVRIEADQELVVSVNGDVTDRYRIVPWSPGEQPGEFSLTGSVWSLRLRNASQMASNVFVISVE